MAFRRDKTKHQTNENEQPYWSSLLTRNLLLSTCSITFIILPSCMHQWSHPKPQLIRSNIRNHRRTSQDYLSRPRPKGIVWLMTFPNSGTEFTTSLVTRASQTSTGTNYGNELFKRLGRDYFQNPDFAFSQQGPYRYSGKEPMPSEDGYFLTKTHCAGYCMECSPKEFITSDERFSTECRTGVRSKTRDELSKNSERPNKVVQYDSELVKKAVHLVRDPFDNIVALFHYAYKKHRQHGDDDWKYTYDKEGFKTWCRDLDQMYYAEMANLLPDQVVTVAKDVPCHAQFYQYVQWHNNAMLATSKMEIPRMVLHYEDFYYDLQNSVRLLLDFLDLPFVNQNLLSFHWNGGYLHHFSEKEIAAIDSFLKSLSSKETYASLARYLNPHRVGFVGDAF